MACDSLFYTDVENFKKRFAIGTNVTSLTLIKPLVDKLMVRFCDTDFFHL